MWKFIQAKSCWRGNSVHDYFLFNDPFPILELDTILHSTLALNNSNYRNKPGPGAIFAFLYPSK